MHYSLFHLVVKNAVFFLFLHRSALSGSGKISHGLIKPIWPWKTWIFNHKNKKCCLTTPEWRDQVEIAADIMTRHDCSLSRIHLRTAPQFSFAVFFHPLPLRLNEHWNLKSRGKTIVVIKTQRDVYMGGDRVFVKELPPTAAARRPSSSRPLEKEKKRVREGNNLKYIINVTLIIP